MRLRPTGPLFGFTLRGMLVITTLLAIGVALVGTKVKQAREEKAIAGEILRGGGRIRYEHYGIDSSTAQNSRTWFERLIDLDLESHVVHATLSGSTVTDDTVAQLAGLPHLRSLNLIDTHVAGTGLAELVHLPKLGHLRIVGNNSDSLTDAGLAAIARLPGLSFLVVQKLDPAQSQAGPALSEDALVPLARMPGLTQLELYGGGFTDAQLRQIPPQNMLLALCLSGTRISDLGLAGIATALPELQSLQIMSCPLDGEAFASLRRCQKLETLSLRHCAITDDSVAGIAQLSQLEHLSMWQEDQLTDEALRLIGAMTNLTWLDVEGACFTDVGARHLGGLASLTQLLLNSKTGKFTDAGPFVALPNVTNLTLGPYGLPVSAAEELRTKMPRTVFSSQPPP